MALYTDADDNNDESTGCGIGSWRPKWLHRWTTPRVFLFLFALEGIFQGGSYMYVVASLTTLEKRYAFGSLVSGTILLADDVSGLIFRPLFGYLANKVHRPRAVAWGMMIVSFGCFVATIPYMIYGPGVHMLGTTLTNKTSIEFCDSNRDVDSSCAGSDGTRSAFIPVMFIWMATALNGIGNAAFWTIGVPFIDDSVKKKNSPIFISTTVCFRLLGPTSAFFLSSYVLTYYENPLIDPGITDRRDPRYVGAWWIGFAIYSVVIFIFALPLFLFPREFPKLHSNKHNNNDKIQIEHDAIAKSKADAIRKANSKLSLVFRVKRLLKNPILISYLMGNILRLFGVLGYMSFKPKYMESQYKQTASKANLFTGIIGIVPSATGVLLGGVFIKYLQPGPKALTSFVGIVEVFGTLGYISGLFLGCPPTPFAALPINNANLNPQSLCNMDCACSSNTFKPICGPDNYTNYFSPCFAGCKPESIISAINGKNQYSSCDCFGGEGVATEGYCPTDCDNRFDTYVTIFGIANFIGTLASVGNYIITLRIVDKYDKSLATGLLGALSSLFAFIPYPLVYGAVINTACEVWESKCGKTGNCLVYDSDKFRNRLHGLTLTLYFLGSALDVIVVFLSSRIKNLYDDEEEDNDDNNVNNDHNIESETIN